MWLKKKCEYKLWNKLKNLLSYFKKMFKLLIILTSLTLKVNSQSNTTTLKPASQAESIKIYFI